LPQLWNGTRDGLLSPLRPTPPDSYGTRGLFSLPVLVALASIALILILTLGRRKCAQDVRRTSIGDGEMISLPARRISVFLEIPSSRKEDFKFFSLRCTLSYKAVQRVAVLVLIDDMLRLS